MSQHTSAARTVGDTPKGGSVLGFYAPKGTPRPPQVAHAAGVYLWDVHGKRYLDATSGAVVTNIGHGNPQVLQAMQEQARKVTFAYPRFFESELSIRLSDKVCELAGEGFDRAFFVSGGSEANESAIKLARQYAVVSGQASRVKVISRNPSYHGATLGALAVTGDSSTLALYGPMVKTLPKVAAPLSYRLPEGHSVESFEEACAAKLETIILSEGPASVLAFIMEPIGGLSTGGVVSSPRYFQSVRKICDHHGVLLIFDEIMSGAGRTGEFLSAHHWADSRPDLVTLAKGLAAGYTPLGAVLAPNHIVDAIAGSGGFVHGHTYFTNPLSCAVANAVLDEVTRLNLVEQARDNGCYLENKLRAMAERSALVGDVRGKGLLLAIELVGDKESKKQLPVSFNAPARLTAHGLKRGIALYNRRANKGEFGDFQMITPPLTSTRAELDELVELLEQSLSDLQAEIHSVGLI
ncbi:aspartate aminotransferase family protein [Polaromonas sp. A23]|uniref:aminotransferase family protein n=1 Tax=Polaromonas sp. A23 TaxID=1944133 RepID=UPI00098496ED|nr:aminotransferase class III-fold pyridoxal phosphate-dependent enzyme [Polaromonas sp. A23]OOG40483.1 aspartate aminotransferase family protein [Polaromonas sp. A23]